MDRNPAECRFDPFSKIWEICEYFTDEIEDQAEVRRQAAEYADEEDEFNNPLVPPERILAQHEQYNELRPLANIPASPTRPNPSYLPKPVQHKPMDLLNGLRVFHGLVTRDDNEIPHDETLQDTEIVPEEKWKRSIIVMHRDPSTPMTPNHASLVHSFIQGLIQGNISPASHDLARQNIYSVKLDHFFNVFTRRGSKFFFNATFFATFGDELDVPWSIVLQDMVSATIVYRMIGYGANFQDVCNISVNSQMTLIEQLVSYGIPFQTLVPTPHLMCSLKGVYPLQAVRLDGHVFTRADLISYKD
ncbi:hypothetical protein CVT24_002780, partial [Panaeolus cyanescens]